MKLKFYISLLVAILLFLVTVEIQAQWVSLLPIGDANIQALCVLENQLFASSNFSLYQTTDQGNTWKEVSYTKALDGICLAIQGSNLYYGTVGGIIKTDKDAFLWTPVFTVHTNGIAFLGENICAATHLGVYVIDTKTNSWNVDTTGFPATKYVYDVVVSGKRILAGTEFGIYFSDDSGHTWNAGKGYPNDIISLSVGSVNLLAGTSDGGIWYSDDNGNNWKQSNNFPQNEAAIGFAKIGKTIFVFNNDAAYSSNTDGISWTPINDGYPTPVYEPFILHRSIVVDSSNLYVGTWGKGIFRRPLSDFGINDVKKTIPFDVDLSLSPNATSGIITIHHASTNIKQVAVSNILGETVIELAPPNAPEFTLDLSKLPPGTYFARFSTGNEVITRKIIRE